MYSSAVLANAFIAAARNNCTCTWNESRWCCWKIEAARASEVGRRRGWQKCIRLMQKLLICFEVLRVHLIASQQMDLLSCIGQCYCRAQITGVRNSIQANKYCNWFAMYSSIKFNCNFKKMMFFPCLNSIGSITIIWNRKTRSWNTISAEKSV